MFLIVYFEAQKFLSFFFFLILMKSNLPISSSGCFCFSCHIIWNHYSIQGHEDLYLFPSKSFIVLACTFSALLHLELIFYMWPEVGAHIYSLSAFKTKTQLSPYFHWKEEVGRKAKEFQTQDEFMNKNRRNQLSLLALKSPSVTVGVECPECWSGAQGSVLSEGLAK